MADDNWRTEQYKGVDVYVRASATAGQWTYAVRVGEPGVDASAASEMEGWLSGKRPYASEHEALQAAFTHGYALVDDLQS
jgi:hypothetical protein